MMEYRDLLPTELEAVLLDAGEQKFRAKQVFKWIHEGVENFDDMTDLSKGLREKLKNLGYLGNMVVRDKLVSQIDGTVKYLMQLKDGSLIECVMMKYEHGNTICISTQAGCSMGCSFCASAIGGKIRDLSAGEMLGQVLKAQTDSGLKISNVVLMGTGEPFDNYTNVLKFLTLLNHKNGINIGMRHITISTCGLVPQILEFAELNLQATLAISLHAPNDAIRNRTMPVSRKYSMGQLLDACRYYIGKTGRRITFEYALIDGLNDSDEDAYELSSKLKGLLCHVNLIPVNKVTGRSYEKSNRTRIEAFKRILLGSGVETTVRRELGSDIDAACGQLRRKHMNEQEHEQEQDIRS